MDCEPELRVRVVAARPDDCSIAPSLKRHRHRPTPILASDAERERSIMLLRDAVGEGRLTLEEFSERVDGDGGPARAKFAARRATCARRKVSRVAEQHKRLPVQPR
jgi:Domain of unknown function (DUF1707)